jgi:hypothetical protein
MEFHGDCWEDLAGESCCKDTELKARSTEGGEVGAVVLQGSGAFKIWSDRRIELVESAIFYSTERSVAGCISQISFRGCLRTGVLSKDFRCGLV